MQNYQNFYFMSDLHERFEKLVTLKEKEQIEF